MRAYYFSHHLYKFAGADREARKGDAHIRYEGGCFPSRLTDIEILSAAIRSDSQDAQAPYLLGNWMYDRWRREEAISFWEKAVKLDRSFSIPWRNLGIAYYNVYKDVDAAKGAYERAFQGARASGEGGARVLYERDQLWKRVGVLPAERLGELETRLDLVGERDDLTVEWVALLNMAGRHEEALSVLKGRRFQPWEGGEGLVLGQWWRTHVGLGRKTFWQKRVGEAVGLFEAGLRGAENLGEAKHLLANVSELEYWAGVAWVAAGERGRGEVYLERAARACGDFREMSVCAYSERSYFSALALMELGRGKEARRVFEGMEGFAKELAGKPARVDYFATSLPAMLLFEEDLEKRQGLQARLIEALALWGLGGKREGRRLLGDVLRDDPNHEVAVDLMGAIEW